MSPQEILDIRKKLKMSQTRFAELLGVSFATVNRWENGRNIPSALAIEKIKTMVTGPSAPRQTLNPYGTFSKQNPILAPATDMWNSYNQDSNQLSNQLSNNHVSMKKMISALDLDYDKEMENIKNEIGNINTRIEYAKESNVEQERIKKISLMDKIKNIYNKENGDE